MKEKSTETGTESRPVWESLEALARQGVQRRLLQQLLWSRPTSSVRRLNSGSRRLSNRASSPRTRGRRGS